MINLFQFRLEHEVLRSNPYRCNICVFDAASRFKSNSNRSWDKEKRI